MTRKRWWIPMLVAVLPVAACQGTLGTIDNDYTGIYYLAEVDGTPVPGKILHDGTELHVDSGTFIISDNGTCFSRTRFKPPGGGDITREVRATYRVEDSRLIMQWENAGVTEGTVDGDAFVMDNHGMVFAYTRGE